MHNTELWDLVEVTPDGEEWMKPVEYGKRRFTSIDTYQRIKWATALFGPVGFGWGWKPTYRYQDGYVIVENELYYKFKEMKAPAVVHCVGACKMTDSDAPKKALTDSITKGLSYLGMCADVFLGKHEDVKYITKKDRTQVPAPKPMPLPVPDDTVAGDMLDDGTLGDEDDFDWGTGRPGRPSTELDLPDGWRLRYTPWKKKFPKKTWDWMSRGEVDGQRHGFLKWFDQKGYDPEYPETELIVKHLLHMYAVRASEEGTLS
jgi:hypothetical protein